jgi:DNA mismatch repair protein MutS2
MPFRCDAATLERLEWPRLAGFLAACAATTRGAEACRGELFMASRAAVHERLDETDEARRLLDAGVVLPLRDVADLRPLVAAVRAEALLAGPELAALARTLRANAALRQRLHAEPGAPRLGDLAGTLPELAALRARIERAITEHGEIRDDATPELRRARRAVRELEGEIEQRMAALLRDPDVERALQERYSTSREQRPVLPVRADARGKVRGIVHDVSASGTTVFIEPEAVVELSNGLRMAQVAVEREIERLLRELADAARAHTDDLEAAGATLERLDLAFARGRLSARIAAYRVALSSAAPLELRGLRHPLLQLEVGLESGGVANDVCLPSEARALILSGPNAGGKTVLAKALGLAALCVRAGLHVTCAPESRMPLFDAVHADIGDAQDLREGLSTFSARMARLSELVEGAGADALVILDEVGEGTEPGEGAALAQAALETLVERGAHVIATTHFNRLKELAGADARFVNASAEFDPQSFAPTYRLRMGLPGSSGALWVAERMGLPDGVLERARALMDRDDSKLEALTRSLSELRQELEAERRVAQQMREASDAARSAYEERLERLRHAREEALAAMKADLELAYRGARSEIASVVRSLQQQPPADVRQAESARRELHAISKRVEHAEKPHRVVREPAARSIDWNKLLPGVRLEIAGFSREAILLEAPDRHGRIMVRSGSGRVTVPCQRVVRVLQALPAERPRPASSFIDVQRGPAPEGLSPECDLRGLRVDEALDRADAHLHSVLATGAPSASFIHGHGTGARRSAIRSGLRGAPGVRSFGPAAAEGGGEGVTIALLEA